MAFTGIPLAALDFYEDLENDNSKSFWTAHKPVYDEHVKAPLESLSAELEKRFGAWKLFRPYRDVRFSKDKTPYKTHQGVWFGESCTYLEISAAGLFLAAGYWWQSSAMVGRLRRAVDDDVAGAQLERALVGVRRRGYDVNGDRLQRVPSGYDKEHPRAELLKHRTLTVGTRPGFPDWLATPQARPEIAKIWRGMTPVVTWLQTHVGHD